MYNNSIVCTTLRLVLLLFLITSFDPVGYITLNVLLDGELIRASKQIQHPHKQLYLLFVLGKQFFIYINNKKKIKRNIIFSI